MIKIAGIDAGTVNSSTEDIFVQVRPQTGAITVEASLYLYTVKHRHDDGSYYAANHGHSDGSYYAANHGHSDGSYSADNHGHSDGSYGAASHNHNVSIGDGISDSGSLNATELSEIKLYHYNTGTSSWDLKHTISNTGKTLDTDVDLSDGGTYPDAAGSWKVEIKTDSSDADLVQGVIKCKHQIDN